jgi:cobalamin biosynthesis protein CobW
MNLVAINRVPVTVLTGFLGAGKTTLLRSLLSEAGGRRIAVIVNEFGDAGFDGGLVEECAANACAPGDIVELTNGCICCTVAEDFIPTMDKLLSRELPLDAIVIETSGLALPQPLLKAFAWPAVRTRATVDGVVTVVDSLALSEGRISVDEGAVAAQRAADPSLDHDDPVEEVFEDQLACADLVVLSKSDLVAPDALAAIEARLATVLRPGVRIVRSQGALAPQVLIGLAAGAEDDLKARAGRHGEEEEHDHDDFDSIVVTPSPAGSVETVRARVSDALGLTGVLRVKGHARIDGKPAPMVVQAVGNRVELSFARPDLERAEHLVVIGLKGFDSEAARRVLAHVPAKWDPIRREGHTPT